MIRDAEKKRTTSEVGSISIPSKIIMEKLTHWPGYLGYSINPRKHQRYRKEQGDWP